MKKTIMTLMLTGALALSPVAAPKANAAMVNLELKYIGQPESACNEFQSICGLYETSSEVSVETCNYSPLAWIPQVAMELINWVLGFFEVEAVATCV